jgi:hypothetical protein
MIIERVRRLIVLILIAGHIAAPLNAAQAQRPDDGTPTGVIKGEANREAKKPYENFAVWIVDLNTAQVVQKTAVDVQNAAFGLSALQVPGNYLVQLVEVKKSEVVCTEGPFRLTAAAPELKDVKIDCGIPPAGFWLLGVAAAIGITAAVTAGPAASAVR